MAARFQEGSFRGVAFKVQGHEESGGRRLTVHEYPGKDEPYPEDQGRKAKGFSLDLYVLGADYMAQRDELVEALDAPGPGTLVHPWRGRMQVSVPSWTLRETTDKLRIAHFSVQFVPYAPPSQPGSTVDTAAGTDDAAQALVTAAQSVFEDTYTTAGQPGWAITALGDTLNDLAGQLGAINDDLLDKLTAPSDLAQSIVGAAYNLSAEISRSVSLFDRVAGLGVDIPRFPFTTPVRQQQAANQAGLIQLTRQALLAAATSALAEEAFTSRDDAEEALTAAAGAIEALQNDTGPDGAAVSETVYFALNDLRAAITDDIQARGLRLPQLSVFTPQTTMPALVIAHHLYGDAARDQEIIERNIILMPGFVPGGTELEVLADE